MNTYSTGLVFGLALALTFVMQPFAQAKPAEGVKPRVLLLGDSISMGYHKTVVSTLKDDAVVVRPGENCAGTTKGVEKIDEWLKLDGGKFDVIHFNFGLHDLKWVPQEGASLARQAVPEQYEKNMRAIVAKLKATGAKLIFATTTPYPKGVRPRRDVADAARYNAIALKIMKENDIAINDLYTFALPRLEKIQQPVNVHFKPEGSKQLAGEVVKHLRQAMDK